MKKHIRHKKAVPKNTVRVTMIAEGDLLPFAVFRMPIRYWALVSRLYGDEFGIDSESKLGQSMIMALVLEKAVQGVYDGKLQEG